MEVTGWRLCTVPGRRESPATLAKIASAYEYPPSGPAFQRAPRSYELATRQAKAPMRFVLRADATAGRRDAGARKLPTRAAAISNVRANADATGTKNNNLVQALLAFCVTMTQKLQGLVPLLCRRSCHLTQLVITLPHALLLPKVAAISSQKVTNGILMDLKGSCASEVDPHPAPTSSVKPGTALLKSSSTTMRDLRPRTAGQRRMTSEACTSWPLGLVSAQPPSKRSGPVHVDMANQEPSITRSSKARFCAPVRMAWECYKCRLGVGSTSRRNVGEQRQVQHVNAIWARKVGVVNANGARKVVATASAIQPLKVNLPVRSRQFRPRQRARGQHPAAELWSERGAQRRARAREECIGCSAGARSHRAFFLAAV